MAWLKVFLIVTAGALAGMLMGGAFGFVAAKLSPDFFQHAVPWNDVEPVGLATFCGATAGILLGGALACFGILVQLIMQWRRGCP